ncbi:hypothetical protein OF83DRAFT_1172799 [Amylostereum chailletii]|nr:hypothetical protein OF83DRAFT_1172799 [Amylostereum chailletii]
MANAAVSADKNSVSETSALTVPSTSPTWDLQFLCLARGLIQACITRHISILPDRPLDLHPQACACDDDVRRTHSPTAGAAAKHDVRARDLSLVHVPPDTLLVSFDDDITSTSCCSVKLIKQGSSLDLAKLQEAYKLYWKVIHDAMSVQDNKPTYNSLRLIIFGGIASTSICSGFLVFCGSLELSSRNMVSGAVRLCYALVYSPFLGFSLAIGAEVYEKITHHSVVSPEDNACTLNHDPDVWWRSTPSL